jgi:hypothetical protein
MSRFIISFSLFATESKNQKQVTIMGAKIQIKHDRIGGLGGNFDPVLRKRIHTVPWELSRQRVHAPEPPDAGVVRAVLKGVQSPLSKHLIISLLPVEEVPITPESGTGVLRRVCGGGNHGAKIGIFG